jgi:hypothetical protein
VKGESPPVTLSCWEYGDAAVALGRTAVVVMANPVIDSESVFVTVDPTESVARNVIVYVPPAPGEPVTEPPLLRDSPAGIPLSAAQV